MPVNPPPAPEQSPSVSAPDEHMAFDFDIYNAQFKEPGHYFLRLTVCNSAENRDFSQIKAEKNNDRKVQPTHEVKTDIGAQDEPMSDIKYDDHKWTFFLPKGNRTSYLCCFYISSVFLYM